MASGMWPVPVHYNECKKQTNYGPMNATTHLMDGDGPSNAGSMPINDNYE